MLTRGRHANHLYLQVVGDGDPHSLIRPEASASSTPTEALQQIIARDDSPTSGSTLLRELNNPAARLFQAVQRYTDALHLAAEQAVGPQAVADLDHIERYIPGLAAEPAWPTLRAHVIALAAKTGDHPLRHLRAVSDGYRDLSTAGDMAAVLDWRLPAPTNQDNGPLPWIPGVPTKLQDDPAWGSYLSQRSLLVRNLAGLLKAQALLDTNPSWAPANSRLSATLIGEVSIWRAANGVAHSDSRPTGRPQLEMRLARWQHQLDRAIAISGGSPRKSTIEHRPPSSRHPRHHRVRGQAPRPPAPGR